MRKRVGAIIATAAIAASLSGAAGASAAVEVGNDCAANNGATNYSFVQLARASASSLPLTAPTAGVVTRWKVNSGIPVSLPQRLQVFRATGRANEFLTVAESTESTVVRGLNTFETRIPVQAGDQFGAAGTGTGAPLYCSTANAGDVMGALTPPAAVGSTSTFPPNTNLLVAVSAIIEPDADGDGFGDETQDRCPQSAKVQAECPLITLDSFALVKRGSIVVLVTSDTETPVTVSATAGVAKRGRRGRGGRKPRASASALVKLKGGTKTVKPGEIVPFTLRFGRSLKAQLAALAPGRSLTLRVTANATDVVGRISSSVLRVKLRG